MEDIYGGVFKGGADLRTIFHRKTERINWKKLAAVDIDQVIHLNDIGALRDNIKHLAFCDVDAEMEVRGSDRTIVKMFKMAQLMIDYLLSSQEHLAAVAGEAEERCAALAEETENSKRKVRENEGYINELKRECHRRKKLILAQQQIMDSGPESYHRCPYCDKAFLNGSFLQAHLEKRHSERYIRSMYHIEHKREQSPSREVIGDFYSSSERRIKEMIRQFADQQKPSEDKSEELEEMRKMMESMMRKQRDEMGYVIDDLERRLEEATRRQDKSRSHLGNLLDDNEDITADKARQLAVEKAINEKRRKKKAQDSFEVKVERPIVVKKRHNQDYIPSILTSQTNISPKSPRRQRSPGGQRNPFPQDDNMNIGRTPQHQSTEMTRQSMSVRNSLSNASEVSNFDQMWEDNEEYRREAREEVTNMLAEHLEHHGISRNVAGINDSVLKDKLNVIDMEQQQLSIKYLDFANIRKKLIAEVDREAYDKLRGVSSPKKQRDHQPHMKEAQKSESVVRGPSPQPRRSIQEREKKEVVLTSESDWDDQSSVNHERKKKSHLTQEKEALRRNKQEYEESVQDILRSPKRQSGQINNARVSSDLSNTMDSSMWDHSDSKAVTSVAPAGGQPKSGLTNKISDYGNQMDSFDET